MEDNILDLLGIDGKVIVLEDVRVASLVVQPTLVVEVTMISREQPLAVLRERRLSVLGIAIVATPALIETHNELSSLIGTQSIAMFIQDAHLHVTQQLSLAAQWTADIFTDSTDL